MATDDRSDRSRRFRELMAEHRAAYAEYIAQLQPATTPLGDEPVAARHVDWDAWERAKKRYDAADAAVLHFLRGGE